MKKYHPKKLNRSYKLPILLSVLILLFGCLFIFFKPTKKVSNSHVPVESPQNLSTPNPNPSSQKPALPAFSTFPIVPRTLFDTSKWRTYTNQEIGFSFSYPTEWGEPEYKYLSFTQNRSADVCSDNNSCYEFQLSFPKHFGVNGPVFFEVFGRSSNYTPGRSEIYQHAYWIRKRDFCNNAQYGYFIHCQQVGQVIDSTFFDEAFGGTEYRRYHMIELSGRSVAGLSFGGEFGMDILKEKYSYSGSHEPEYIRENYMIQKAFTERRLSKEILINFDLFEKVFETIVINN